MQLTRHQFHEQVYFYTLILIAVSLPLSVFMVSAGQIILVTNWLAEMRFREKWDRFMKNKALWALLLLYLVHAIGLLWSEDMAYGMKDMRVKLPLFLIPLVVGTSAPLLKGQVNRILLFFTLGVFASTMASMAALLGWVATDVEGYRGLSLFISHIRFSLMIVLSILVAVWFLFLQRNSISRQERIWYMLCLLWLFLFMILLKSLSGIVILAFLGFFLVLRSVFEIRDVAIRFMIFVPVVMIPLFGIIYLGHAINRFYTFDEIHFNEIDSHTVLGNRYKNFPNLREVENGHYVWLYICDKELEAEWSKASQLNYWGETTNEQNLRATLIRFMSSKGLRKDAAGFRQLSLEEVRAVENGVANYLFLQRLRLYPRIYELIWEIDRYRMGKSPNEKSVVQRYLYLDAGWKIFQQHMLFGVGNGDVKAAFRDHYENHNSPLEEKWRRRAHNQFLTFLISFGIPLTLLCIFSLVAPLFLAGKQRSFLATGFFILMILSMINEDTLETSTGASFVAFFYAVFLFAPETPWLKRKLLGRSGEKA